MIQLMWQIEIGGKQYNCQTITYACDKFLKFWHASSQCSGKSSESSNTLNLKWVSNTEVNKLM